jgi:cobyrinic acid a,c-diamide synthase
MTSITIPRVVIAATSSGVGKTTVTVGLIAALRSRGIRVAPFKCGPDYLDPTYHARVAGRASHNLDGWMMDRAGVLATFASAAADADIAVIEGMMGLYDSATPTSDEGSTAEVAKWLNAPVLLVSDCSGMARTVGAIALGFARFDPVVRLAGLICNNVGSRGHLDLLREASPEFPVVGGLPRASREAFPERHLGLFSAIEAAVPASSFQFWGESVNDWCDLDAVLRIARSVPTLDTPLDDVTSVAPPRCRLGLAYDEAFHFYYEYNLRLLVDLGAELVRFSPVNDTQLPDVDGLYFGGGYPEVTAEALSANIPMRTAIRRFAAAGGPIYAECGGLMYLTEGIRALDGKIWPLVGLIPGIAVMHDKLQAIGYAGVETRAPSFLGSARTAWRGHQFRYSTLEPIPPETIERLYRVAPRWGGAPFMEGFHRGNLLASYVHSHWASNPAVAGNFVSACAERRKSGRRQNVDCKEKSA